MSYSFNSGSGLIIVTAEIEGISSNAILRMALDTGATRTLINSAMLVAVGYDLAAEPDRVEMTTGSGIEYAVRVEMTSISALGVRRRRLPVLGHTLPPSAGVDGLLGLDFFADCVLTIDFQRGTLSIS
jgi:predicted aspartyl protease